MPFKYGQNFNGSRVDSIQDPIVAEEDFSHVISFDLWNFPSGLGHRSCLASTFFEAGHQRRAAAGLSSAIKVPIASRS